MLVKLREVRGIRKAVLLLSPLQGSGFYIYKVALKTVYERGNRG